MYAAHLLWGIAQMLMLHNWIAGFAYLVTLIPRILVRIQNEERSMIEYTDYMAKTGAIFPKLS